VSISQQNNVEQLAQAKSYVLYEYYKRNPLAWLFQCVHTINEHNDKCPVQLFPDRPYVAGVVKAFFEESILWIPKSRQMTITWLICALVLHEMIFTPYRRAMIASKKEDDAIAVITRMRGVYSRLPVFLKNLCKLSRPFKDQPMNIIELENGSIATGVPQGSDHARSYTFSRIFVDEAAYLDEFEQLYAACQPSLIGGGKLVAVSSASPSYMQQMCEESDV